MRPNHPQSFYETGVTPFYACAADPRFSYTLYLPPQRHSVLVVVHDTLRNPEWDRDVFVDWADHHGVVLVTPLFPAGHGAPWELHAYKTLDGYGVRYDQVLLAMLSEAGEHFGFPTDRVGMFGFSGGAQFCERFLLLHPERLAAASIAAPGAITVPDPSLPWWVGVRDVPDRFGRPLDPAAIARVPTQVLVGTEDIETWEIGPDHPLAMPGSERAGATRVDRARTLTTVLTSLGVTVTHTEVPGVAHTPGPLLPLAQTYLATHLSPLRQ